MVIHVFLIHAHINIDTEKTLEQNERN